MRRGGKIGLAVSGLTFSEEGAEVWRVDRFELKDYKENVEGLPQNAVVAVRGVLRLCRQCR